jgi:hypothetical protein
MTKEEIMRVKVGEIIICQFIDMDGNERVSEHIAEYPAKIRSSRQFFPRSDMTQIDIPEYSLWNGCWIPATGSHYDSRPCLADYYVKRKE